MKLSLCLILAACAPKAIDGTAVQMDFTRKSGVFSAPVPSDDLMRDDGTIDVTAFPNPRNVGIIKDTLSVIARDARGFSTAAPIFLTLSDKPAQVPEVRLIRVDTHEDAPIETVLMDDGGPFGAPNLLSILPVQGHPLAEGTLYAAVVLRSGVLGVSQTMAELADGVRPAHLSQRAFVSYQRALVAARAAGIATHQIAGLAAFTTDTPTRLLRDMPKPTLVPSAPLKQTAVFADFCVYESTVEVPSYQAGEPPFLTGGGNWVVGDDGLPVLQRQETADYIVTIPRKAMPARGYPLVVHVRAGGGGHWWMVDRSTRTAAHAEGIAGEGPAREYARAGYAGSVMDGPHGGRRNVSKGDEQFLLFNFMNPQATRDNIRQSAFEVALEVDMASALTIDTQDCPGAAPSSHFDVQTIVTFGHSNGAWMSPLAAAFQPTIRAMVLSGAGGSWLENLVHKRSPLDVKPLAEALLGFAGRELTDHDPAAAWVQWAGDAADPQNYARYSVEAARDVLMIQGIVDTYITPPIADTLATALNLSFAGPRYDGSAGETLALPARGSPLGVRMQYEKDPIEDGHEVVFQREEPKAQYRHFLETLAAGAAEVH